MDSVLGLPSERRDEALNALLASLEAFDGEPGSVDEEDPPRRPVLHTANGLFVDKGVPTGEGYLQSLARYYGTGVYPVDFQDEAATKPAIDAWVNQNTSGGIRRDPSSFRNSSLTPRQALVRTPSACLWHGHIPRAQGHCGAAEENARCVRGMYVCRCVCV